MSGPVRIVPAILTDDPEALRAMVRQAEGFAGYVQLDFMDGRFVPSRSVSLGDLAGIDFGIQWEAHLMVEHPATWFADLKRLGASKVIFHREATPSPGEIIGLARESGLEVGIAINPDTPLSAALPFVNIIDSILFMTVRPGYYGSKFEPQVMDKIAAFLRLRLPRLPSTQLGINPLGAGSGQVRRSYPAFRIGVDGGVNESNIAAIGAAGVEDICVGSAIFLNPPLSESYRRLQALAEEARS